MVLLELFLGLQAFLNWEPAVFKCIPLGERLLAVIWAPPSPPRWLKRWGFYVKLDVGIEFLGCFRMYLRNEGMWY